MATRSTRKLYSQRHIKFLLLRLLERSWVMKVQHGHIATFNQYGTFLLLLLLLWSKRTSVPSVILNNTYVDIYHGYPQLNILKLRLSIQRKLIWLVGIHTHKLKFLSKEVGYLGQIIIEYRVIHNASQSLKIFPNRRLQEKLNLSW